MDETLIGKWAADDLRRAFVAGAQWWEWEVTNRGATMWPSDRARAEVEAERRYPEGQPRQAKGGA